MSNSPQGKCCEKCKKCPDYGTAHNGYCHNEDCHCHTSDELVGFDPKAIKEVAQPREWEVDMPFFDTARGILRMKSTVIDGQQFYKNATVKDIKAFISKVEAQSYERGRKDMLEATIDYSKHRNEKFLDGFSHPKDCERCGDNKNG